MKVETDISRKKIEDLVTTWAYKTFKGGFSFREHQKETCINAIESLLNPEKGKQYIVQAPTGSGKSIMAMIVAGVLSDYYGKRGYILISDLSLLDQYIKDIEVYLPEWKYVKGMDNYSCNRNGLSYKMGSCRTIGCLKSIYSIRTSEEYAECSQSCEYIMDRLEAISANVTLCTYHHWLVHQNLAKKRGGNPGMYGFDIRDFVICDEAHKLVDIVQHMYSLSLGDRNIHLIENLCKDLNVDVECKELEIIKKDIKDLLSTDENDHQKMVAIVENISSMMKRLDGKFMYNVKSVSRSKKDTMNRYSVFTEDLESIDMFVSDIGLGEDIVYTISNNGKSVTLNRLNEEYLMKQHFHPFYKMGMFMSATIGDFQQYAKNAAMTSYAYEDIPSTFDFTYSQIYFVPGYKMSMKYKDTSIPEVAAMLSDIMRIYSNMRGCVLVSSYSMALTIRDLLPLEDQSRILVYGNAKEKIEMLDRFKYGNNNYVMIGPSLFDGISLDDDLCRFLVIAKIPYPDLSNKFCNKKREKDPAWYSGQAALNIIQGVGRGVRSNTDWCQTFVLDDCFDMLMRTSWSMFSEDFKKRIARIPRESLKR